MTHLLPIWLLYVLGGILEVAGGVYRGAGMAALPRLFPGRRPEARAALGILYVTTTLVGPLLAGLLLTRLGYITLAGWDAYWLASPTKPFTWLALAVALRLTHPV